MNEPIAIRSRTAGILLGLCLSLGTGSPAAQTMGTRPDELNVIMNSFLDAVNNGSTDEMQRFLPATGALMYVHTIHQNGEDNVGRWRFSAEEVKQQVKNLPGPIFEAVHLSPEGQTAGLLVHQVLCRGTRWTRVRGPRFVPPGAGASSPAFIEWRRESQRWVISSIGDESYEDERQPAWGC